MTDTETHFADNGAGWRLALRRVPLASGANRAPPKPGQTERPVRPVLVVPGSGMNSFIFSFHPRGLSLVGYLASRGLEVWSADLRAQGRSEFTGRDGTTRDDYGMGDLAVEDVGAAIAYVLAKTHSGAKTVDLIGCSLGTALVFAHLACVPDAPVHTVVSMGGLVTWTKVPPLVRALFYSPRLAGMLRLRGTRALAGRALPMLARWTPGLLSMYLHTRSTDIADVANTVIHPDNLVWVVVGDRAKIEAGIRELNMGEVRVIDADGIAAN